MFRKFLNGLLVFTLAFSVPLSSIGTAYAHGNENAPEKGDKQIRQPKKVVELKEKRTENSTTWRNTDLSETVELYSSPVFYQEEGQKEWKSIENTITSEVKDKSEKDQYKFQNKANKFTVLFGSHADKEIMKIKQGNHMLSYRIVGAKASEGVSKDNVLTYAGLFEGVDAVYHVRGDGVKEDFVLHHLPQTDRFAFEIKTSLSARKAGRSVEFFDQQSGQVIWSFTPPFLRDSADHESHEMEFQLSGQNGKYQLVLPLDMEFLKKSDTKYPVLLDPTVTAGGTISNTFDSYVGEYYNWVNYGGDAELRTGYAPGVYSHRSYIKFGSTLPSLSGGLLTGATFKAYKYYEPSSVDTTIYIHRAYSSWASSSITWSNQPTYGGTYASKLLPSGAANGWYSWPVTNLANYWYDNPSNYHGLVMVASNENSTGSYRKFYSSDYNSGTYAPRLEITYSPKPSAPTGSAYGNGVHTGNGHVNLQWTAVSGATGYKVLIFNGKAYEEIDVGNVTSWTTKGKKLWPTDAQVASGIYTLRKDGTGGEFSDDPRNVYQKSGGSYPNSKNYWFRIKAYNANGDTTQSDAFMPTIPDQTAPSQPTQLGISNQLNTGYAFTWNAAADDNSGINHYNVYLGTQPGVWDVVNGASTTGTSYTHTGTLVPRTTYYFAVKAVDKNGNYAWSTTANAVARKQKDAYISNWSIPPTMEASGDYNVTVKVRNEGLEAWTAAGKYHLGTLGTTDPFTTQTAVPLASTDSIATGQEKTFYLKFNGGRNVGDFLTEWSMLQVGVGFFGDTLSETVRVVDTTPPTGEIVINQGAELTNSPVVKLKLSLTDNANGPYTQRLSNDQLTWTPDEPFAADRSWTLSEGNGTKTVAVVYKDSSGNPSATYMASILLDTSFPTALIDSPQERDYLNGSVEIRGTVNDNDVSSYSLSYGAGTSPTEWTTISTAYDVVDNNLLGVWNTEGVPSGLYTLRLQVVDAAGNKSTTTKYVWVDQFKDLLGQENYWGLVDTQSGYGSSKVNLGNGNLYLEFADTSLKGRKLSAGVTRSYNSQDSTATALGKGWRLDADQKLTAASNGDVTYTDEDGTRHLFVKQTDGNFTAPKGLYKNLTLLADGGYSMQDLDALSLTRTFDAQGKLTSLYDLNGNKLTYVYTDGQLQEIVDSIGRKMTFLYQNNQLSEITSAAGTVKYVYTGAQLTGVEFYDNTGKLYRTLGYNYDGDGRLTEVTDPNGHQVNYLYNGLRVVKATGKLTAVNSSSGLPNTPYELAEAFRYDLTSGVATVTLSGQGKEVAEEYTTNAAGNVTKIVEDPLGLKLTRSFVYQDHLLMDSFDRRGLKTSFTYDGLGNVLTKTEPTATDVENGTYTPVTTYEYKPGTSWLVKETDPLGRVTRYDYDSRGNKTLMIDADGFQVTYGHDEYGNPTRETSQRGALYGYLPNFSFEEGEETALPKNWKVSGTWNYNKTEVHSGTRSLQLTGNAALESDYVPVKEGNLPARALGYLKTNEASNAVTSVQFYDSGKNLIGSTASAAISGTVNWTLQHAVADLPANTAFVTYKISSGGGIVYVDDVWLEEANYSLNFAYDDNGLNLTSSTDAYGKKKTFEYDALGNKTKEINELGQVAQFLYNADGQVLESIDRLGKKTINEYDKKGNLIRTTNALGQVVEYQYDEQNHTVIVKHPRVTKTRYDYQVPRAPEVVTVTEIDEYNALGQKVAEKDGNGSLTLYEYDLAGRLVKSIDPMQNELTLTYDANGNKLSEQNWAYDDATNRVYPAGTTHYRYDELNRLTSHSDPAKDENTLVEQTKYDAVGNEVKTISGTGVTTEFAYDKSNRSISSKDSSTPPVQTWSLYDGEGNLAVALDQLGPTYYVHDLNGLLREVIDPQGNKTVYSYNAAGDKTKLVDATGTVTNWEYDAEGQLKKESKTVVNPQTGESKTEITLYEYDALGQVTKRTLQESSGLLTTTTKEITYVYDELGRLVKETGLNQPAGTKTENRFYHDDNGNVLFTWTYDETNAVPVAVDPDGDGYYNSETVSEYDGNNRLMSETISHTDTKSVNTYDNKNNQEKLNNALGDTFVTYDNNDRTKQIVTPNFDTFTYEYLVDDSISRIIMPGIDTSMTYNGGSKVKTLTAVNTAGTAVVDLAYTYSDAEQVTRITDKGAVKASYTYAPTGNLETVEANGQTLKYTYDANSNIAKVDNLTTGKTVTAYTYETGDRILQKKEFDKTTGALIRTTDYEHKPSGTLKKAKITAGTNITLNEYVYNSDDQLMSIAKTVNGAAQPKISYEYDTEGNRIAKNVNDGTVNVHTHYHRDVNGGIFLETIEGPNRTERLKFYRDADGNLLSFTFNEVVYYYQFNARGDVIAITDSAGNVKATYDYDEWGNVTAITGDTALADINPYRYVGKFGVVYDKDANLYLMGWRDYDPSTGRFIAPDEYEGTEEDPTSLNHYLYADADPVNNIDPDGHAPKWMQKAWKSTKKFAKKGYNFAIGDDIKTLRNPKSKWYHKAGAALSIASNFIPGAGQAKWAIKGGVKAYKVGKKALKTQKKVTAPSLKNHRKSVTVSKSKVTGSKKSISKPTGHSNKKKVRNELADLDDVLVKPVGNGSTGRVTANNLKEQLAMKEVMSNPRAGSPLNLKKGMTDKRWPQEAGWVKMSKNVNGVEIHYVYNKKLNAFDDFKFVDPKKKK